MSDDQTNIDKYRLAANITEYHINLTTNHVQYRIWNPHQIFNLKKKKKYSNRSINKEIGLMWS